MLPPKQFNKQPEQRNLLEFARAKVTVHGAVQGVGFRPFVYRLASQLHLNGWVLNSSQGVFIEVEGRLDLLQIFLARLEKEKPPLAIIQSLEYSFLDAAGYDGFEIRYSDQTGPKTTLILPDIDIRLLTAPIVDPGSASSKSFRTIGQTLR
jgi:acylphosphatase